VRPVVAAAAVVLAVSALGFVTAADTPIPLTPSTGYRDYCDGLKAGSAVPRKLCPAGRVLGRFWRPLVLPTIPAGARCPVSQARTVGGAVRAHGTGPVYIARTLPLRTQYPAAENSYAAGTGWAIDKVPLLLAKGFHGPFLVRGRRIDGDGALGFSGFVGHRPYDALQFAKGGATMTLARGLLGWGTALWMTTPGCYAVQIDGRTFTRVIVFRVEFAAPS
jgi:hypothetical protein